MALTVGYLRFYRRHRIAPGVGLNFSKSGPSVTLGGPGLHYTIGHHRRRVSVGVPGTGLSYVAYRRAGTSRGGSRGRAARSVATRRGGRDAGGTGARGFWIVVAIALLVAGVVALVTTPVGLGVLVAALIVGAVAVMLRRRSPIRAVGRLLDHAHAHPERRAELVEQAYSESPEVPAAVVALASLRADQQRYEDSRELYRAYLAMVADDPLARLHLGQVDLLVNDNPAAVTDLAALVQRADLGEEVHLGALAALATAYLHDGQAATALQILQTAPLRRRQLSAELQQCLLVRAGAHYALGQHAAAANDADRLYALTMSQPIHEMAQAMREGTFTVATGPPPPHEP